MNGGASMGLVQRLDGERQGMDRRLAEMMYRRIGSPRVCLELWNGERVGPEQAVGCIRFRERPALWCLPLNMNLHFGDAYIKGAIEIEGDLTEVLTEIYRSMPEHSDRGLISRLLRRAINPRRNTLRRSRKNIQSHYDLGNDFYRLWLDRELIYTCAYYTDERQTLEAAQFAKMEHICRKLRLCPGETVVEAGCGWGALALHMGRYYDVRVRAYNISSEQIRHARQRAREEGLDDRVEFIEDDYRHIDGEYDVFVSVGMLEHVGREHHAELGRVIDRCLKPDGRGLLHSVGRNRPQQMSDWIEKRIFPGSYVPALSEMLSVIEPHGFSVLDVENLRMHYARTLRDWLERFEQVSDQVERMFDASFVKAWRLYLGGCSAAFAAGSVQLFQLLFARPGVSDWPLTRAHLYRE